MKSNVHYSVMQKEAIEGLDIKPEGLYLDLTLGRAGDSLAILNKLTTGKLISVDQDEEAISYSKEILSSVNKNYEIIQDNFRNIKKDLLERGIKTIDGALYDLGVSSPQFDEDYRGFSYRNDAPLDMRMNIHSNLSAKEIVNTYSLKELVRVFKEYGEEKYSYEIAKNILKAREISSIDTTYELVDIIKKSKPHKELEKKGHPAKQVFQALRIEVNDEMNALKESLEDVINLLDVDGRLVVITFQSLEDRIVKKLFKKYSVIEGNRINEMIDPKEIKTPDYVEVNKKVITPSDEELKENHRSNSAKLRILKRIKWGKNMKDKLFKTNHHAVYYYFRKLSVCFGIFICSSAVLAIPISIAATVRANQKKTHETEKENENKEVKDYTNLEELLKY